VTSLALAFDLGTGGCKASLWDEDARMVAETVSEYATEHPAPGRNEQRPQDWWDAIVSSTRTLLERIPDAAAAVAGIALSGQSLGAVQLDDALELVRPTTPIWSDARGRTAPVFAALPEPEWYRRTGNGFGAALYPVFKAATFAVEDPDAWARTRFLAGSKDWINLRLTGRLLTDHSMASGSGAYSLAAGGYDPDILDAAALPHDLFATPVESTDVVGPLARDAASALGLLAGIPVFAGAVDNAAMALGSRGTAEGRLYAALGSSSWMTVTSARPVLDEASRPYVFRHAIRGFHVSALSTFSSGTTIGWLRDLVAPGETIGEFVERAAESAPGARGAVMIPTLAGGTPLEGGSDVRGALLGLELGTSTADVVRAGLEGIAFALDRSLRLVRALSGSDQELLISGGGSRSPLWNRIYADILGTTLVRTSVDQQAATLGAAAIVFVGLGAWPGFARTDDAHVVMERIAPHPDAGARYASARSRFDAAASVIATLPPDTPTPESVDPT
jgi:xylulokinase